MASVQKRPEWCGQFAEWWRKIFGVEQKINANN